MTKEESLQALRVRSADLNAFSDQLSAKVAELESELKKFSLGVSSYFQFSEIGGERCSLGYCKLKGKWGLTIRIQTGNSDDALAEIFPFNEAPRGLRVMAVNNFWSMVEKMIDDAGKLSSDIETATQTVQDIIRRIKE